ncbi:hypothetical protein LP316_02975 [Thalassotalea sp. LPB0316]|uniref:hypothetical protein n=1 Tax=Thalassotalea sp. LPB0316 TaxID=2769490 RepID=UPI00186876D6|nr:hypothetical protein [Thalassotalea sp. LPB0316]QOL26283.1 hypothetical protein LP316_02975 [Thalassotalea sp. LPB0316]
MIKTITKITLTLIIICQSLIPLQADENLIHELSFSIREAFSLDKAEPLPRVEIGFEDLNNDGYIDALVSIVDRNYCGTGGCSFAVFKGELSGFSLLSRGTITSPPIYVKNTSTNGWRDLIVNTGGVGAVNLEYNGTKRFPNPSMSPKASPEQVSRAKLVIEPSSLLLTAGFYVAIAPYCPKKGVQCDKVRYFGQSLKSGNSLVLIGEKKLSCEKNEGCKVKGFEFVNGTITYFVSVGGELTVLSNNDETLVNQDGEWKFGLSDSLSTIYTDH